MGCYKEFPVTSKNIMNEDSLQLISQGQERLKIIEDMERERKRKIMINPHNKRFRESPDFQSMGSSGKLSVSPSLSSLLNQRKSQKLNNRSKNGSHHYHKYQKNSSLSGSFETKLSGLENKEVLPYTDSIKRRRSSSYWFNTNINNSTPASESVMCESIMGTIFDPLTFDDIDLSVVDVNCTSKTHWNVNVKIFDDLCELDLINEYSVSDVNEFFTPKFDIKKNRTSKYSSIKVFKDIELGSIMETEDDLKGKDQELSLHKSVTTSPVLPSINKEIMQPHFMRLYALEQNSKCNGCLPDLDIDENILSRLSYEDIWTLDVPKTEAKAVTNSCGGLVNEELRIKLALMTRKKLWCDMIVQVTKKQQPIDKQEQTLASINNKNSENKQKLIALHEHQFKHIGYEIDSRIRTTSLLRLKDGPLPWNSNNNNGLCLGSNGIKSSSMNKTVIKPFGVLPNSKKTQYVVKGWVDKRFFRSESLCDFI